MKRKKVKANTGIKTAEFWATLIGSVIVAGGIELGLELDEISVGSIAVMVVIILIGRICSKSKRNKHAQLNDQNE